MCLVSPNQVQVLSISTGTVGQRIRRFGDKICRFQQVLPKQNQGLVWLTREKVLMKTFLVL